MYKVTFNTLKQPGMWSTKLFTEIEGACNCIANLAQNRNYWGARFFIREDDSDKCLVSGVVPFPPNKEFMVEI